MVLELVNSGVYVVVILGIDEVLVLTRSSESAITLGFCVVSDGWGVTVVKLLVTCASAYNIVILTSYWLNIYWRDETKFCITKLCIDFAFVY